MNTETWSRDRCTCGHEDVRHEGGSGRCGECTFNATYNRSESICTRYQWNGKPRKRTW